MGRALAPEVWHYTDGAGLVGILETGQIHFTQISCLNDALEHRYFGDLVLEEVAKRQVANTDPRLFPLYSEAIDLLSTNRDFSAVGHFVACFSEVHDDLGQWRGYGGGECGYAIGFSTDGIFEALKVQRPGTYFIPLNYKPDDHHVVITDVVNYTERAFLAGEASAQDKNEWARELGTSFAEQLTIIPALIKHPAFEHEKETRLLTQFGDGEHSFLIFRQKRTLLARHLPVGLATAAGGKLMPITKIVIGPGPAQHVSRVSVGDLLAKAGYPFGAVSVELSKVPYRVP